LDLTEEQVKYAASDLLPLPSIMRQQQELIQKLDLQNTINIEMNAIQAVVWLENCGIYVDKPRLEKIKIDLAEEMKKSEAECFELFQCEPFNLNSNPQLKEKLNSLGIPAESVGAKELCSMTSLS
jgi:DNA polymerase I-like protein with 3'-5' exonuclease and polymerase domains